MHEAPKQEIVSAALPNLSANVVTATLEKARLH